MAYNEADNAVNAADVDPRSAEVVWDYLMEIFQDSDVQTLKF